MDWRRSGILLSAEWPAGRTTQASSLTRVRVGRACVRGTHTTTRESLHARTARFVLDSAPPRCLLLFSGLQTRGSPAILASVDKCCFELHHCKKVFFPEEIVFGCISRTTITVNDSPTVWREIPIAVTVSYILYLLL